MIELKHLSKTFETAGGRVDALKDVSLTIPDGDVYGIIGMSGAGKSTLVRCINLLEKPTAGEVVVDGQRLDTTAVRERILQMVQNLEGMGFTVVPFGQGFKDMSPPTKELMKLVLEEKIAHGGHPVLRWMMDNIHVRTDPAGNLKPDKEKSTEKIDGAVAAIMALDRAIRGGGMTGASIYDERGLLLL